MNHDHQALSHRSALANPVADAAIRKLYGRAYIRAMAKKIRSQVDADAVKAEMRDAAILRSELSHPIDLAKRYRRAKMTVLASAVATACLGAWVATNPEGNVITVAAALAAGAVAATVAVVSYLRMRDINDMDRQLPSVIEQSTVEDAHRLLAVFGEPSGGGGVFFIALASATDGALAAFVLGDALDNAIPLFAQIAIAFAAAAVLTGFTSWASGGFERLVKTIRARLRWRNLAKIDFDLHPDKRSEAEFVESVLKDLTGDDLARPTWRIGLAAAGMGLLVILPFALLAAIRLAMPDNGGIADAVTIGFAALCAGMAAVGCIAKATGSLIPQQLANAYLIRNRFPTIDAFKSWKESTKRSLRRWANGVIRAISLEREQILEAGDPRHRKADIRFEMPFEAESSDVHGGSPTNVSYGVPGTIHATRVLVPSVAQWSTSLGGDHEPA